MTQEDELALVPPTLALGQDNTQASSMTQEDEQIAGMVGAATQEEDQIAQMVGAAQGDAFFTVFLKVTTSEETFVVMPRPSNDTTDCTKLFIASDLLHTECQKECKDVLSVSKMRQKAPRALLFNKRYLKPCDERGRTLPIQYQLDENGNKIPVLWRPADKIQEKSFEFLIKGLREWSVFEDYRTKTWVVARTNQPNTRILADGKAYPKDNFLCASAEQNLEFCHYQLAKNRSPFLYLIYKIKRDRAKEPKEMVDWLELEHNSNKEKEAQMRIVQAVAQAVAQKRAVNLAKRSHEMTQEALAEDSYDDSFDVDNFDDLDLEPLPFEPLPFIPEDDDLFAAATKAQTCVRLFLARHELKRRRVANATKMEAATKVQARARLYLARRQLKRLKRLEAANKIRSYISSFLVRQRRHSALEEQQFEAATKVEALVRSHLARQRFKVFLESITTIQASHRQRRCKKSFLATKEGIIKIQVLWRQRIRQRLLRAMKAEAIARGARLQANAIQRQRLEANAMQRQQLYQALKADVITRVARLQENRIDRQRLEANAIPRQQLYQALKASAVTRVACLEEIAIERQRLIPALKAHAIKRRLIVRAKHVTKRSLVEALKADTIKRRTRPIVVEPIVVEAVPKKGRQAFFANWNKFWPAKKAKTSSKAEF